MAASPSQRDRSEKRLRILTAARKVCAQRGYEAARMEEIAAAARVSKGTLYHYFASKEELFLSTVLDGYHQQRRLIEREAQSVSDARSRLGQLLRGMAKSLVPISGQMPVNFQVWGVMARNARARGRMFAALRAIYADRSAALREVLREGMKDGAFRSDLDVVAVIDAVNAIFDGFVYRSTFDPARARPEDLHRCLTQLVRAAVEPHPSGATRDAPLRGRPQALRRSSSGGGS